jgi:hypothetical protein
LVVLADALLGAKRDLDGDVREAEIRINLEGELVEGHAFRLDLLGLAEDVAVVLREAAHAHDPVQGAGGARCGGTRRIRRSATAGRGSCACPS